ncbi:hypothetical protein ABZ801_20850 [Actinomadura sp. NPDC047616]|uniref:hypothetical protein n=1 Tax=Actinomadura sp. NPDC047616 TaxID=3155914 RepID=UPI0033C5CD7D
MPLGCGLRCHGHGGVSGCLTVAFTSSGGRRRAAVSADRHRAAAPSPALLSPLETAFCSGTRR